MNDSIGMATLERVLRAVTAIRQVWEVPRDVPLTVHGLRTIQVDFARGEPEVWLVLVEKGSLKPRQARLLGAALERLVLDDFGDYAVVVAPFVSPRSAEILAGFGLGFVDGAGNCKLISGPIYVERSGHPNPHVKQARLRSLFTAGAERVLRAVLDPMQQGRSWTVRELADAAFPGVSVGQAHKVAKLLEEQEFMRREADGLTAVDPEKLLNEWVENRRRGRGPRIRYYSPLSQSELRSEFCSVANWNPEEGVGGVMASFSAAEVLAPYVRQHRFFAYWTGDRSPLLKRLQLRAVDSGENFVLLEPSDEGVFYPAGVSDQPVTCPVQTYLDLSVASGRGEEAARAVFEKWLKEAYAR